MKAKLTFFLLPALAALVQFSPAILAQSPADKPGEHFLSERHARWASLTQEEQAKLKAAHEKALADPVVRAAHEKFKQARREFREVMRPALLKADPSLEPILEKLRAERAGRDE
jgi:hypothetical protein